MILTGLARLGRDVEVRFLQDGTPVANLALAYNYGQKDDAGKRPTQWVNASLWGKRAEGAAPYLLKGTLICAVCDDVHIETFKRQDGSMGSAIKARVVSFEFAGGQKKDEGGGTQQERSQAYRDKGAGTAQRSPATTAKKGDGDFEQMVDDIPF